MRPHVLPDDWHPPASTDLPDDTAALVRQWPAGAYQHFSAQFRDHWSQVDRKKRTARGHGGAFRNWLRRVHPDAMRAAKAGLAYAATGSAGQTSGGALSHDDMARMRPAEAAGVERRCSLAPLIRARCREEMAAATYLYQIEPVAISVNAVGGVTVTARLAERIDALRQSGLDERLTAICRDIVGRRFAGINYVVEQRNRAAAMRSA